MYQFLHHCLFVACTQTYLVGAHTQINDLILVTLGDQGGSDVGIDMLDLLEEDTLVMPDL